MAKKKTLGQLKKKLWKLTSEYVRRSRADGQGFCRCFTCDRVDHWKRMDAGHAIPGRHNAVLFDLDIIRPQCMSCNRFKHGEQYLFAKRLDAEYWDGFFDRKLIHSREAVKFTSAEIQELIEGMKEKLNDL